MNALLRLVAMASCLCPAVLPAANLGATNGAQWFPFLEWTLTNPSWDGNAFDVRAAVTFTHKASGEQRRTEMFHAGGQSWSFRFTGTRTGEWTWASSSDDPDLDGHTGAVRIAPNPRTDAHGFLKNFGGKWGWEGTETAFVPQLAMWDYITGNSSPRSILEPQGRVEGAIEEFIVRHGFDGFHLAVIGGYWFNWDAAGDRVEESMTEPDPRTFDALELLIRKTHAAGGMVHLWPWGDHQRRQTPRSLAGGLGGSIDRRLQRYIAARLGPIPGWSMGYGFDLDEWVTPDQIRAWRDGMHQLMGWHHFLGGRPEGPNQGTDHATDAAWNQGLDYSSYEHHRPTYDVYRAALLAVPGRPVLSEDRFRIRRGQYAEKDYDAERVRRGLYHSTMAGGVGNIWGIHPDLGPGGVFPNRDEIKTYAKFFHERGRFLADMEVANHLGRDDGTRVLLSRGAQSLVLYRESTAEIRADLSSLPGPAPAVAINTQAAYKEIVLGELPPNRQTIRLPMTSDWVVAVGKFQAPVGAQNAGSDEPARMAFADIWNGPGLDGGHGVMWADTDSDGLPDLYMPLIFSGTLPDLFLHNKGGGSFVEEGRARGIDDSDGGSHGAAWCDLDNDGDYDLINGTTFDDGRGIENNVFRNRGDGRFDPVAIPAIAARKEATRAFIALDWDADGDLDLFGVSNYQGSADPPEERNEVYRNVGGFRFESIDGGDLAAAPAGQGATDTDFDGDGDVDILAANRTGPVNILQNNGQGVFTRIDPAALGIRHMAEDGITSADVDNDGDMDLLLASSGGRAHLYLNDGKGRFTHAQSFAENGAGYMGGFADLDNDGDLDLYLAGDAKVFVNNGRGNFSAGAAVPVSGRKDPRGVAFADLDNDGDLDFAVGDKRAGQNFILRNDLRGGGNWLKIRLMAPNGQAGALGAKTLVSPAGQTGGVLIGMRESQSNCGYLGQNDPVLHVGVGRHQSVDVEVRFLDGTRVVRTAVRVNQVLVIDGGK